MEDLDHEARLEPGGTAQVGVDGVDTRMHDGASRIAASTDRSNEGIAR
ncbi:MAG: hypothetical protein M9951_05530 [Burkholderiaceae bacterium]|jgi:hypothetical protein|nr:hypothetical protein [Burkholderiaceae bacterium]MEB2318467.1 hypothetical protein [Pseudomonadota bacterium]